MYSETIIHQAKLSAKKLTFLKSNPLGYLMASILAGIYVGFGVVLVFSIGGPFAISGSPAVKLVMGASFGVALTLVVFAGSELFTGNTMYATYGIALKKISWIGFAQILFISWIGNLIGSIILGAMAYYGGSIDHAIDFFGQVTAAKMNTPIIELLIRAILCNMLVCLALWTSTRTKSDAAKILLIFWCLFAFIGAGFEHSIANMTLLTIGLLSNSANPEISMLGFAYNLLWVTIGNFIGGSIFIAGSYLLTTKNKV